MHAWWSSQGTNAKLKVPSCTAIHSGYSHVAQHVATILAIIRAVFFCAIQIHEQGILQPAYGGGAGVIGGDDLHA